jgi:OmpA-OmpF porin, OOP family
MKSRYLISAGAALAVAFGCAEANAQFAFMGGPYPTLFYVGPEGGWTSLSNQRDQIRTTPFRVDSGLGLGGANGPFFSNFNGSARYNSGFNAGGRLGLQYGPWRVEEEYSYRHNGLSSFGGFFNPGGTNAFSGERVTHSIMTNVIYDFTIGWPVTPHIGFGIGAVDNVDSISLNTVTLNGLGLTTVSGPGGVLGRIGAGTPFPNPTLGGTFLKGSQWNFGYQAIVGVRYDINPLLAFDLDYRYLATTSPTFTNKGVAPFPPFGFPPSTVRYNSGYNTQNIVASLTMKFGAPPAPPPPAPPAPPPPPTHQVYLVFFDWDKYNITPEGQQIIQLAANQYRSGGRVTLQVTGYTDTSGSAGYNQRLSERRANAVAAALERLGVPRSDMVVAGRGENDLRVPTPNGVREPQNRRVEIVFP